MNTQAITFLALALLASQSAQAATAAALATRLA